MEDKADQGTSTESQDSIASQEPGDTPLAPEPNRDANAEEVSQGPRSQESSHVSGASDHNNQSNSGAGPSAPADTESFEISYTDGTTSYYTAPAPVVRYVEFLRKKRQEWQDYSETMTARAEAAERDAQSAQQTSAVLKSRTKETSKYKAHLADANNEIEELKSSLNSHVQTATLLKSQLQQARTDVSQWQKDHAMLETKLRAIQEQAFKRFDSPMWKPDSNDGIRRKLHSLDVDAKAWSKRYCIPSLNILNKGDQDTTESGLHNVFDSGLPDSGSWVILQAYIMERLFQDVFEKPFFGLGERFEEDTGAGDSMETDVVAGGGGKDFIAVNESIELLYDEFTECNRAEAMSWRVSLLRQLTPPPNPHNPAHELQERTRQRTEKARSIAVKNLKAAFLGSGICQLLKDPENSEMQDQLEKIVSKAVQLSYSLWTQKIDLEVKVTSEIARGKPFQNDHDLMEPHQLHRKHLDENQSLLDGRSILIVTHPALVRRGDQDGMNFDETTVLKKAVCWMGDPSGA